MTVTPELFVRVAAESIEALVPLSEQDWAAPSANEGWSCWETGVHLADAYFHHAARTAAQPEAGFVPASVVPDHGAGVGELLQVVSSCAALLRDAGLAADPSSRAWHPWGDSDPAGSLAMGAAEGLLHTWDITSALGSDWLPPAELSAPVLERLFPDPPDLGPTDALLWCTGRVELPGHARRTSWRWHAGARD